MSKNNGNTSNDENLNLQDASDQMDYAKNYNMAEEVRKSIDDEINRFKKGFKEIETKKTEAKKDIYQKKIELEEMIKNLIQVEEALNRISGDLQTENAENTDKKEEIKRKKCNLKTVNEIVDYIDSYIKQEFKMDYKKDIIERFYYALKTNQIIILSGPPGTGKTSLVEVFSKAVGANYKIISVQPNWSDNQDLLGFYNPIEKRYISTPFLDALVKASEDKETLYIICLDEMNLARVEYYFSELLSAMERKNKNDRVLNLYSEFEYEEMMRNAKEIKNIKNGKGLTEKEKEIIEKFENLKRYKAIFPIPENVRFVGTINVDETTKQLSPKVIDRSFIIEMHGEEKKKSGKNTKKSEEKKESLYIPYREFKINDEKDVLKMWNEKTKKLMEQFENIGVSLNNRFYQRIKELYNANDFSGTEEQKKFIDYVIASKILPKVSFEFDEENFKDIKTKLKNYLISKKLFEKMIENAKNTKILTFWS